MTEGSLSGNPNKPQCPTAQQRLPEVRLPLESLSAKLVQKPLGPPVQRPEYGRICSSAGDWLQKARFFPIATNIFLPDFRKVSIIFGVQASYLTSRTGSGFGENVTSKSSKPDPQLFDADRAKLVYEEHSVGLGRFLLGLLRNEAAAADALQTTFIRLLEKGHTVQQRDSLKSWLFRVAYNEAMLIRRRKTISRKHAEGVAWKVQSLGGADRGTDDRLSQSVHFAIQQEDIQRVRKALTQLPDAQRAVVEMRIYEGLKFREIAEQLDEPLGTVLARMQAGLKKLKPILKPPELN